MAVFFLVVKGSSLSPGSTVHCIYGFFAPQNPGQNPGQKSGQKPVQKSEFKNCFKALKCDVYVFSL